MSNLNLKKIHSIFVKSSNPLVWVRCYARVVGREYCTRHADDYEW